jgi:predicted AAA+ superfamily ATPase
MLVEMAIRDAYGAGFVGYWQNRTQLQKSQMERYLEEHIRRDMAKKIIILSGPRHVGKTTLFKQLVPSFIRTDLLDLERVRDLKSIEVLIDLLRSRVGSPTSYSSLARDLQVSVHTVKHWLQILENLCVIFGVRPYHRNVARSLLKEPKYYFYDIGAVEGDIGVRLENTVALGLLREMHLLKDSVSMVSAQEFLANLTLS